jgi:hypothetical protein
MRMPPDGTGISVRQFAAVHRKRLNAYLADHPDMERARARLHMLLGALLSHCSSVNVRKDRRAVCWPSLTGIGEMFGYPPRSIRRMLRELEQTGVIMVLCGSAVGEQDRRGRQPHDGGFVGLDGRRVTTSARAYQFIFADPCDLVPTSVGPTSAAGPATSVVPVAGARSPVALSARTASTSRLPALPPAKRAEIESEIGADGCAAFVAWVETEWSGRAAVPPRPFEFWNARVDEWRERITRAAAAKRADREVAATAQQARELRDGIARTAPDRAVIAADVRQRLAAFPTEGRARG